MAHGKPRHTTLIPVAGRICRLLRRAGLQPHPGVIDPKGGRGGATRVKVAMEPGRVRIRVAAGGVQELFLYGAVQVDLVLALLREHLGPAALEAVVNQRGEGG